MVTVSEYNLPDIQLMNERANKFLLWIPDKTYIVLGASNNVNDAVHEAPTLRDNITVLKRRTGGQTVMLTPNNLIISAVITDESIIMKPKDVFNRFNNHIISAIAKNHTKKFTTRGISDIALGEMKILGSSMYRGKEKLFYHAVLNFSEPSTTFQKYLKHPSNEPDYRKGRMHHEFVTSLKETGYPESIHHLKKMISESLSTILSNYEVTNKPVNAR